MKKGEKKTKKTQNCYQNRNGHIETIREKYRFVSLLRNEGMGARFEFIYKTGTFVSTQKPSDN